MSVDLHVKVQVRKNDSWEDIAINGNSVSIWCGRWLYELINGSGLDGRGLPDGMEQEEYCWGFTHFSPDEFHTFLESSLSSFFREYRESTQTGILSRIESKIDSIMNNSDYYPEDNGDYSYEVEDGIWDVIGGFKLYGYVQYLKQLYEADEYIPDGDVRIILWFS